MKVITVGNGFIANHLLYPIIEERLQADNKQIELILNKYKPDVVVNCMGYCGVRNIDDCELNKEKTLLSNLIVPTLLATECNKMGIKFIHLGSGCIYYGESPNLFVSLQGPQDLGWKEHDNPKLQNASFYSKIKYAADLAISNLPNSCVLRLRMPISHKNNSRNLINKLLKYTDVLEHPNSVTFIDDLVRAIDWAIKENKTGIYHITNPEPMTHIDLLEEYRKYHPEHRYNKINEEQLKQLTLAPRSNCILNTDKLNREGFVMTPTKQALQTTIEKYVKGN